MCSVGEFFMAAGRSPAGNTLKRTFLMKINARPQRGDRPSSAFVTQPVSIAYYIPLLYRTLYSNIIAHLCRCIIIITLL